MTGKTSGNDPNSFRKLRERAERMLRTRATDTPVLPTEDVQALIHELSVHQIELEIQNEELRRAQVELAHTRDRYVDLYDFAPVGYVALDQHGMILEANLSAATMLGVERKDLLRANISNFVTRQSQDACYLHRQAAFSGDEKQRCDIEMHKSDGTPLVVRLESIPIVRDHERECRTALLDITAQTEAEASIHRLNKELEDRVEARTAELARKSAELERREREFRTLADNVPALFSYIDREQRYRYANSRYEDLFRRPATEIVGKTVAELLGPARFEGAKPHVDAALSGEEVIYELEFDFPDGTHTMHVHYVPDLDDAKRVRGIFALITDVTDKTRAEERILQSERLAAIGETVTGLAHESRNALQRSQAAIERLARRMRDNEGALQIVRQIQRAQDDLHRIYEEVREYAGPIRLNLERCRLTELVTRAWEDLEPMRKGRRAGLRQHAGDLDVDCMVDRTQLRRVIRNILENSLAAMEGSERPLAIHVGYSRGETADGSVLSMAIHDNGPGLTREARRRVFDAFFTTKTHGTGLGMAIAKRVVEAHGGTIRVGTVDGTGAEIVISLPWRTE